MENMTDVYLYRAAKAGKLKEVIKHLDAGADVNYRTDYKDTPLTIAAYQGHLEIVELLLSKGADIYAKNYYKENALRRAAGAPRFHKNHIKIIDLLISKGLGENKYLDIALYDAAVNHKGDTIKYLLEKGANVNMNTGESTVLHEVVTQNNKKLLQILLKGNPDMNPKDSQGWTPLRLAVEYNKKAVQKLLIKHGAHE